MLSRSLGILPDQWCQTIDGSGCSAVVCIDVYNIMFN